MGSGDTGRRQSGDFETLYQVVEVLDIVRWFSLSRSRFHSLDEFLKISIKLYSSVCNEDPVVSSKAR